MLCYYLVKCKFENGKNDQFVENNKHGKDSISQRFILFKLISIVKHKLE